MEKLYTVNKTRLGADCGSDHELLHGKFRLKLKKVGKTTRPLENSIDIPYKWKTELPCHPAITFLNRENYNLKEYMLAIV